MPCHGLTRLTARARRLVLEAAGEVLAAGAGLHAAEAARSGVFVGLSWTEYARLAADAGTGARDAHADQRLAAGWARQLRAERAAAEAS